LSVDFAPNFTKPFLSSPRIFGAYEYFEFMCTWRSMSIDGKPGFKVKFLFDGEEDADVARNTTIKPGRGDTFHASLHERFLHGKLGKWVS